MTFWGVHINPGQTYILPSNTPRLRITRASIKNPNPESITHLTCRVGDGQPIFLCPVSSSTVDLNYEFQENQDTAFSVEGQQPQAVYLSGYFLNIPSCIKCTNQSLGDDQVAGRICYLGGNSNATLQAQKSDGNLDGNLNKVQGLESLEERSKKRKARDDDQGIKASLPKKKRKSKRKLKSKDVVHHVDNNRDAVKSSGSGIHENLCDDRVVHRDHADSNTEATRQKDSTIERRDDREENTVILPVHDSDKNLDQGQSSSLPEKKKKKSNEKEKRQDSPLLKKKKKKSNEKEKRWQDSDELLSGQVSDSIVDDQQCNVSSIFKRRESLHIKDSGLAMVHENVVEDLVNPATASTSKLNLQKPEGKKCHQCLQRRTNMVYCEKCKRRLFCSSCMKEWYPLLLKGAETEACPSCLGNCSSDKCLSKSALIKDIKELGIPVLKEDKVDRFRYLISLLYPFLKRFDEEQCNEKKLEAKFRGRHEAKLQVCKAKFEADDRLTCDNCKTSIADFHRTCLNCKRYDLCLNCCQEVRKMQDRQWKVKNNGDIRCPMKCYKRNVLRLRSLYEPNWVSNLKEKVENLVNVHKLMTVHSPSSKCLMSKSVEDEDPQHLLRKASSRKDSEDNYLYCPSANDLEHLELGHFLKHWKNGEPVIVKDALNESCISWDPRVLSRGLSVEKKHGSNELKAVDCLTLMEDRISWQEFLKGYSEGRFRENSLPKTLKVKDFPENTTLEKILPRHCADFVSALPFPEYTNPYGILNVSSQFPLNSLKPDLGPKAFMAYGFKKEFGHGNSVTKLHCDVSDAVNILMHVNADSDDSVGAAIDLGGAVWDIFRREDVRKLEEYLLKHHSEFKHYNGHFVDEVNHPILDQSFFLTEDHKRKLKEEYGIEAWTFVQSLGEAVLIPAGCPHQVRNIKSCVKVAMDFVSPENIDVCIRLADELRSLPDDHSEKGEKLQVMKMILHTLENAAEVLERLTTGN